MCSLHTHSCFNINVSDLNVLDTYMLLFVVYFVNFMVTWVWPGGPVSPVWVPVSEGLLVCLMSMSGGRFGMYLSGGYVDRIPV